MAQQSTSVNRVQSNTKSTFKEGETGGGGWGRGREQKLSTVCCLAQPVRRRWQDWQCLAQPWLEAGAQLTGD